MGIVLRKSFRCEFSAARAYDRINAQVITFTCELQYPTVCPLFQAGKCVNSTDPFGTTCPNGSLVHRASPTTTKARAYYAWEKAAKAEVTDFQPLVESIAAERLLFVPGWVYLGYSMMNHVDGKRTGIPFEKFASFLSFGSFWMRSENFTPDTIGKLVNLRPHAMMGGEIEAYQSESVPVFLYDLKIARPAMFASLSDAIKDRTATPDFFLKSKTGKVALETLPAGTTLESDGETIEVLSGGMVKVARRSGISDWCITGRIEVTGAIKPGALVNVTPELSQSLYDSGAFFPNRDVVII